MAKQVFPKRMVAHVWANRSQESGRNAGGTLFFRNDTIYSYGEHFPIARHVETKRGRAVLFTTKDYSVTTGAHKSAVASACSHLTVFHVSNPVSDDYRALFKEYQERFTDRARRVVRARSNKAWLLESLRRLVDEANQFAEWFGIRSRLRVPDDLTALESECKALEARERARIKRERAKREKELREKVAAWVAGESEYVPGMYDGPIRLRIKGEELQTSRGAVVPLDHAIKAFGIIKRLHDKGEAYQRNGHTIHIGHFALDAVDTSGNVRAGCHNVEWAEIERVATLAGVN